MSPTHTGPDDGREVFLPADGEDRERSGRSVSFYLAIFLGLLLVLSAGLNLLLFAVSLFGSATAGLAPVGAGEDPNLYQVVTVGGDRESEDRALLIPIQGAISEGASPLMGASGGTVSQVERALRLASRDESIKGVLLDINSPGGGVTDSDLIWRALRDFQDETGKPVVALFGDIAASGGYYIAAAAKRILARPTTTTGSIGVIMQSLNLAGAAEKFGIRQETIVSARTPFKDMMSPFRPMRDEERAILTSIVDDMYDRFVEVVDEGRPNLDRDQVIRLADGRIYSAEQALDAGLVDELAGLDRAYEALAELCEVDSLQIIEQRRVPTLADLLFGVASRAGGGEAEWTNFLRTGTGPRLLYWWSGGR